MKKTCCSCCRIPISIFNVSVNKTNTYDNNKTTIRDWEQKLLLYLLTNKTILLCTEEGSARVRSIFIQSHKTPFDFTE